MTAGDRRKPAKKIHLGIFRGIAIYTGLMQMDFENVAQTRQAAMSIVKVLLKASVFKGSEMQSGIFYFGDIRISVLPKIEELPVTFERLAFPSFLFV